MDLVIISNYESRGLANAITLLREIRESRSGVSRFDICLAINSDRISGEHQLSSEDGIWRITRNNSGMNIGAWDCAWRALDDYEGYLFLQDECRLARDGWLDAFTTGASAPGIGLLGESANTRWAREWRELLESPLNAYAPEHYIDDVPARRVECYLHYMKRHNIDPGQDGGHLRSLVWFLKRDVLERINGFPCGRNRGECIGAEIAVSRKIVQSGLRFQQISTLPFTYFWHEEWRRDGSSKA
jgi:hypothetical protein